MTDFNWSIFEIFRVSGAFADRTFQEAVPEIRRKLQAETLLRLFVDGSAGMGHQSASVHVLFRLIFGLGFNAAGKKIEIVYRTKWPDHPGPDTLEKLGLLLPGFDPGTRAPIKVGHVDVSFVEFTFGHPPSDSVRFGFTGGAGIKRALEEKETIKDFAEALNVDYFLRLQPYLWVDRSELYMDRRIDPRRPPETVLGLDRRQQYDRKAYYVPRPQVPPADVWAWYEGRGSATQKKRVRLAHTLAQHLGDLRVCPLYGLREKGSALAYPSFMLLPQIVAGAAMSQQERPGSIVIVGFDDVTKTTRDTTGFLLAGGQWPQDTDDTHGDREAILEAIFGTPLDEKLAQRVDIIWADDLQTTADDLRNGLQWAKKTGDRVLLLLLGSVPPPIFNYFFSLATLPAMFEGLGTAALALSFGTPFLHLPRREAGTAGNPPTSYPLSLGTGAFLDEKEHCQNVARWVTLGLASVMPEYQDHPDMFSRSIEAIAGFIRESHPGSQSDLDRYFAAIGGFFGDQTNDRLLTAAIILNGRAPERAAPSKAPAESSLFSAGRFTGLDDLLAALQQHTGTDRQLDLFAALPQNRVLEYLQTLVEALASGSIFPIKVDALTPERDEQNNIVEITLEGSTEALGLPLNARLVFVEVAKRLACTLRFWKGDSWSLAGVPWVVIEEPGFEMTVMEAPVPVEGSVFGTVGGSGLTLQVHYPTARGWLLRGEFEQGRGPSLSKLFSLAGGTNLTEGLPLPSDLLRDFALQDLEIDYDQGTNTILEFRATLGTPGDFAGWEILKGLVPNGPVVRNLGLTATVTTPGNPPERKTSAVLGGDIALGEALTLRISARLPDFLVSGGLSEGDLPLKTLLDTFLPGISPPFPAEPKITDFRFAYAPGASEFRASATIQGAWSPDFDGFRPITLEGLKLEGGYQAGIYGAVTGTFRLDGVQLSLQATSPGKDRDGWVFKTSQTQGDIKIAAIIDKFLPPGYQSPGDLDVRGLEMEFDTGSRSYMVAGEAVSVLPTPFGDFSSGVSVTVTSTRPADRKEREYSGHVEVAWDFSGAELLVRYDFAPDAHRFLVDFNGFVGQYEEEKHLITFRFGDRSLGEVIALLTGFFTSGRAQRLEAPWDILNGIGLKNLELKFDTRYKAIGVSYGGLGVNLGFLSIDSLELWYSPEKNEQYARGVWLALDGQVAGQSIEPWDVTRPESAPQIPGHGNRFFDLRLLALGQHVAVAGAAEFADVSDAIARMRGLKNVEGETIPVGGPGQPVFSETSNWLIATNFGILRFGDEKKDQKDARAGYLLDLSIIFNDPNLYGLRLELDGEKAKIFKGLKFEILYKKITDTVGVYQTELTLPDQMRNLDFGAVAITLPVIGLQVYTNGDFKVDIGFPYNMDFSRSFTAQGIIAPGIPVLGSGGVYFGRLSGATSSQVPRTSRGLFNPVMAFGLGLQLGIGRQIDKGVLKAGFSITVVAVIEGVIASWHPYNPAQLPAKGDRSQIQDSYYFWLQGTVGLLGRLYGSIDFAVIKASVNVTVYVLVRATYESYRAMPLALIAGVKVSVALKINLGLFRITLRFSFSAQIREQVLIGRDEPEKAPWYDGRMPVMRQALMPGEPVPCPAMAWRTLAPATRPVVNLYLAPLLTVSGEGATDLAGQSAQYVAALFIDTAGADKGREPGGSSFENLCREVLRWLVASFPGGAAAPAGKDALGQRIVTRDELSGIYGNLSQEQGPTPIPLAAIGPFLRDHLDVRLQVLQGAPPGLQGQKEFAAAAFPMPPQLRLQVPAFADQTPAIEVDFSDFTACDATYLEEIRTWFRQLETEVEDELTRAYRQRQSGLQSSPRAAARQSLGSFIFQDYFVLLARHLVQSALDATTRLRYPLQPTDSIDTILAWANGSAGAPTGNALSAEELVRANASHPLSGGRTLILSGISSAVKESDTFAAVARRYGQGLTAAQLIAFNRDTADLLRTGAVVSHGDRTHTLVGTDTIRSLATALETTVEELAGAAALQTQERLLQPLATLAIPPLAYTTRADGSETLAEIVAAFGSDLDSVAREEQNRRIPGLFRQGDEADRTLDLPGLAFLTVDMIMAALDSAESFRHLAGMSSRYQMHGVRLPVKGRQLSFKDPNPCQEQEDCGLFRLTGQQFALPRLAPGDRFSFSLAKGDGLDWLTFVAPQADGRLEYTLEKSDIAQIDAALALVLKQGLRPHVEQLAALENFQPLPRRYTFPDHTRVQAAGPVPLPYRPPTGQMDGTPLIWAFPEGLLQQLSASRHETVQRAAPRFSVQLGAYNETTATMRRKPAGEYGWGTRLEVSVKKLESQAGHPTGACTYELIGADEAGIALLERLLAAMNGRDDLIDRIFILYRPNPAGSNNQGLQTMGSDGFAAFITQSNLSTYTQPVQMTRAALGTAEPEQSGVLGSAYDFVKLLWECSIVRSGGFHLFYRELDGGRGFPQELFDDKEVASVSLLVTYARPTEEDARDLLGDFMNCVATGDRIDTDATVVFVQSEVRSLGHAVVKGERLRDIAARCNLTATQVAEQNRDIPLSAGAALAIRQPVYLVRPASEPPGRDLAKIAAYFGVEAAAIKTLNPQVADWQDLPVFTLLRLPDATLTVSADPKSPLRTLAQIAAHYGISVAALADANQDRESLFPAGSKLAIQDILSDRTAAIAQGNVGLHLIRSNPGEVPPDGSTGPNHSAWAPPYLGHCYSLLSYAVAGNRDFNASSAGLPVGPTDPPEQNPAENDDTLFAAEEADRPWDYQQVIPIHRFARFNPIRPVQGLPTPEENIYAGVGTLAQVRFQWRDYFGNETLTPLTMPDLDAQQPLNQPPLRIGYTDPVIGLDAWPGVSACYDFTGTADQPVLQLLLRFDPGAYRPDPETPEKNWREKARRDQAVFRRIYYQLHQTDAEGRPHLRLHLATTLVEEEGRGEALTDDQTLQVQKFVQDIYRYLGQRTAGKEAAAPAIAPISRPIDPGNLNVEDIFPLSVTLRLERDPALVDDNFKDSPPVRGARTAIHPQTAAQKGGDPTLTYRRFARNFEKIFVTGGDCQLKIATGIDRRGMVDRDRDKPLWVVRFGLRPERSIAYAMCGPAVFYGARPLSTSLVSRDATVYPYRRGRGIDWQSGEKRSYAGIELDTWARQCLGAIDAILAPELATPAFLVDQLTGGGNLQRILAAKQALARVVAEEQVAPILQGQQITPDRLQAAQEAFRQQLLLELGNAYTLTAIVQFPVKVAADFRTGHDVEIQSRLYGMPTALIPAPAGDAKANRDYALSTAKISLTNSVSGGESDLTFLFTTRNVEDQTSVSLDLAFRVSHLERDIQGLPGIDDYQASSWLAFVNPPQPKDTDSPLNRPLGQVTIPVPLKAYPPLPSLVAQQGEPTSRAGATARDALEKALQWDYLYTYTVDHHLQDVVYTQIKLNLAPTELLRFAAERDLFADLAQFVSAQPGLQRDLARALRQIDLQTPRDAEALGNAAAALGAFAEMIEHIAAAWPAWSAGGALKGLAGAESAFTLKISEGEKESRFRVTIEGTPLPGLALPEVEIAGWRQEPVAGEPGVFTYFQENGGEKRYLDWRGAKGIAQRRVRVAGLNILQFQNAWASAFLRRNEDLVEIPTAEEFIYQTPEVHFAERLIPLLDVTDPIDMAAVGGEKASRTLPEHLARLFTALFARAGRREVTIQLECRYAYTLQQDLPPIELPILLLPPTPFRAPEDAGIPAGGCAETAAADEALTCSLARALSNWFATHSPDRTDGRFRVDLRILSHLNESQMPLLRLRGIFLEVADIEW